MDQSRFDELVRRMQEARSRREAIRNAAGAALGLGALGSLAAEASGKKGKGGQYGTGKPGAEGPCGSGKRKDNICTKNGDCCTGVCEKSVAKKNKDKKGRCRCIRTGFACKQDKNCCNSLCVDGMCGMLS
jgi:hypothetical protein